MKYCVYKIEVNGVIRYIGRTNDFKRRSNEHRRGLKKGLKKKLYDTIKEQFGEEYELSIEVLETFKTKVESKRYEMYLILKIWWENKPEFPLYQTIPPII